MPRQTNAKQILFPDGSGWKLSQRASRTLKMLEFWAVGGVFTYNWEHARLTQATIKPW